MLNKVMGADFFADDENLGYRAMEPDTEVPSHMTLSTDEDGTPTLARFTYVDEDTCIGCKNCAFVARSTFFMEESFAGKARVYNQGGDSEELIDEAIDSCPVNCIHYVAHEDLVTLETERLAREDNLDFNNYASFKRGWTGQEVAAMLAADSEIMLLCVAGEGNMRNAANIVISFNAMRLHNQLILAPERGVCERLWEVLPALACVWWPRLWSAKRPPSSVSK